MIGFPVGATLAVALITVAPAIEFNGSGCIVEWIFFIIYAREERRIVSLSL
jgi:hypothetical protein